ncbi:MAG: glycosyltransferase family A protein [Phreatobacter sp.]|nr:glycosyltransferase family A protein [Phreatobacter sp.]
MLMKVRNALMRFRRMTPARIYRDHARARHLMRDDTVPRPRPVSRPERLVISLTTVPERMDQLGPVLRSLLAQTEPADRIVLARPEVAWRSGKPYPPFAPAMPGIDVIAANDQGPATKLLPALLAEPDAAILVVDDDVIYPIDFVEQMLAWHRRLPHAAIGWRGWSIVADAHPKDYPHIFATALTRPEPVDILLGTWGYLVPPGALDAAVHDFSGFPPSVRFVDDVWFSGHLARRGVQRLVIPGRGLPIETRASGLAALTFGPNSSGANDLEAIAAFREFW